MGRYEVHSSVVGFTNKFYDGHTVWCKKFVSVLKDKSFLQFINGSHIRTCLKTNETTFVR